MNLPTVPLKRCAVYCRVSSDERLDQSFNSIDAQKEAGQAFIASQRAEGWIAVADDYDDGGYSGGNMDRPALKRLLAVTPKKLLTRSGGASDTPTTGHPNTSAYTCTNREKSDTVMPT